MLSTEVIEPLVDGFAAGGWLLAIGALLLQVLLILAAVYIACRLALHHHDKAHRELTGETHPTNHGDIDDGHEA